MKSNSDSEFENVPYEISNAAAAVKAKSRYENAYNLFTKWMDMKKCKPITENVILAYLAQKCETLKSSTLCLINLFFYTVAEKIVCARSQKTVFLYSQTNRICALGTSRLISDIKCGDYWPQ